MVLDVLTLSLDDSTPINPIFFILSEGADPVHSVEVIAKRNGMYESRLHRVALGEGQDVVAMSRLEAGHKEGHWVVLENIHLMPRWNAELEKKLDEFAAEGSHPDFRVFLSAEPSTAMPIGILERSIKLTNEPPQGLKANLKRAFASFEKDEFEFKDPKVKSILFSLCHFHSVMIERIKFGPKGWNKSYPFSTGVLMCSNQVLANDLESGSAGDKVPWSDLRYIFGEISQASLLELLVYCTSTVSAIDHCTRDSQRANMNKHTAVVPPSSRCQRALLIHSPVAHLIARCTSTQILQLHHHTRLQTRPMQPPLPTTQLRRRGQHMPLQQSQHVSQRVVSLQQQQECGRLGWWSTVRHAAVLYAYVQRAYGQCGVERRVDGVGGGA